MKTSRLARRLMMLSGCFAKSGEAACPATDPFNRPDTDIEPAESYEPEALVWVHVGGGWCRGRVVGCLDGSVLVRYFAPGSDDVAVEAVTPSHLLRRKT